MTVATALPQVPSSSLRGSDISTLVGVLKSRQAQKLDVVVPTNHIRLSGGNLIVGGLDEIQVPGRPAELTAEGVSAEIPGFSFDPSGLYKPTHSVDQNLADLFKIPVRYIRKLREEDTELLDINVNRHADRATTGANLVRLIWGSDPADASTTGLVRAILSDRYAIIDHLDTVLSILSGLKEAGLDGSNIQSVDLSENKLYLNIEAPEIAVHGRSLIKGYRSPYTGQTGEELPLVHAGIKFTNSENGRGAFQATPYALFQVCKNGATINAHKLRKIHLGRPLEAGQIQWSQGTVAAANELVRNQVRDAVKSFLSTDFLNAAVDEWEKEAGVEVRKPVDAIKYVAKELSYTETEQDEILADFVKGGQITSGGIGHAVTSVAQRIEDPDRAHEFAETHQAATSLAARFASAN
ncbi:hypothetical protein SEA_SCENTAE_77 [Gordonia phage SCentae]|nr:hypothetical protein SEA_SCENTAE_77 [Gordonia phage SCentae]